MPDDSQMFWDDSIGQFISAPAFIFNDIHGRSANRFIASSKLPSTDFALEGDGFRWLSRQGGCEMQFHQGRWQARGAVQSWHPDLINYGPCRELLAKLRSISPETEP